MSKHNPFRITHAAASTAILAACDAGTLTQGLWHGTHGGREIACLLGSIHPHVRAASDCNGDLMPMWLAELTPVLFDGIPAADIVPIARRYGGLVARWHALTEAQWNGILTRFLVRTIDDAVTSVKPQCDGKPYWPAVEIACEQAKAAIILGDDATARAVAGAARAAAGGAAPAARAADAADAVYAAADAARAAARAAADAADAVYAAAGAAAGAARAAADAAGAVYAVYAAVYAADAVYAAAGAAAGAARAAADAARAAADAADAVYAVYLRLFNFLLDQIEGELTGMPEPDSLGG